MKPKETIYLIIDESGAKGFSENEEKESGEFGLIAGYIFHEKYLSRVNKQLSVLRDKVQIDGKKHITDLDPKSQELLRKELFEYILDTDKKIVYHGTYVQGLHDAEERSSIKPEIKKNPALRFHFKDTKERLLSETFSHIFGKSVCCAIDNHHKNLHIEIITDQIDEKILKEYEEKIETFFGVLAQSKTRTAKGYNIETNEKLLTTLTTQFSGDGIDEARKNFSNITYKLNIDDSPLTFAADIISNSLYRFIKQRIKTKGIIELNSKNIFSGHELEHQIYGLSDKKNNHSDLSDIVYRHPNAPSSSPSN